MEVPREIQACLSTFLDSQKPLAALHWSPVDNLHITTKFIGEWPEDRLGEMITALATIVKPGLIDVQIHGVGWFPNEHRPRVLWAGVATDDKLSALAKETDNAVAQLGVPREGREFSPHLTLARIREAVPLNALRRSLESVPANFGSFRAGSFFLYLSKAGRYRKLAEFTLE